MAIRLGEDAFICQQRLPHHLPALFQHLTPLHHELQSCTECVQAAQAAHQEEMDLANSKLPAMDLYSGGGGSVEAAQQHFKVSIAIDVDPTACMTLQTNHPNTKVYCGDIGDLHRRAQCSSFSPDIFDQRDHGLPIQQRCRIPNLPSTGSIALLTAGPPCQAFTGANIHPHMDDERIDHLWITLDEVKRLKPSYFLLENVPGIKRDRNDIALDTVRNFAQASVRRLVAQDYQVRLSLLNSRAYGSPQNRVRLFILAAARNLPLPRFPAPTHSDPDPPVTIFSLEENDGHNGFYTGHGTPGTGPLPALTIHDAISDLPRFEDGEGPQDKQLYRCTPRNDFQAEKRGKKTHISDHYTANITASELRIIDQAFDEPYAGHPGGSLEGTRRRADPNGSFYTLMTSNRPGGKATGVIHPTQRRTFSIAERKRAQGFPDRYKLCGTPAEQDKQLGNAVCVDIGRAIHGEIIRSSVMPLWRQAGKPQDVAAWWSLEHSSRQISS